MLNRVDKLLYAAPLSCRGAKPDHNTPDFQTTA